MGSVLIGNTFPLTLMRRSLTVEVVPLEEFRRAVAGKRIVSFWGHPNTLHAASTAAGFDLTPREERPVLTLSPEAFPMLDGEVFRECWIISPDSRRNFCPSPNNELKLDDIQSWQCLRLVWKELKRRKA